jgi:hypothetical protein
MMTGMSKRVVKELRYDASLDEVSAMLADPAFREQVLSDQKVLRGSADVTDGVVTIEQVQAAEGLPSFATKIVGDEIAIIQRETWTSPDHADVEVSIPGKPGEITGTTTLLGRDGGTVQRVDLAVSVRIPLVGGKLEGLVVGLLEKALDKEQATGRAWLAAR